VGVVAVLRYIHAAGPTARLTLEQVPTREPIEVETPRVTLANLDLKVGDLVNLRLRQSRSFDDDYSI
jgi:sulfate transport system ATP-binding protein